MSIETSIDTINSTIEDLRVLINSKLSKAITINGKSLSSPPIILTKHDLGLGNVNNTSDAQKPVSSAQRVLFDSKVDKSTTINGISLSSNVVLPDPLAGRFDQVDNTRDVNKPVSTAQQVVFDTKADKTTTVNGYALSSDIALDSVDIGLDQVNNTSDPDKPISIATQGALDVINSTLGSLSTALGSLSTALGSYVLKTTSVNGHALSSDIAITKSDIGLSDVDNTSDAAKPICDAQALVNASKIGYVPFLSSSNFYLRSDMFSVQNASIDFFPVNQRGSDLVAADYTVSSILYLRVYTVDGEWQADIYLPSTSAYSKYTHIYFHCASTNSFTVHASRSDQSSGISVNTGEVAVFVSTPQVWAYLGKLDASL